MLTAGTLPHSALMVLLVAMSGYAGYALVTRRGSRLALLGRLWVMVTSGVVGIDGLGFGGNALLLLGYQMGLSVSAVQLTYVAGTVISLAVWERR